MQSEGLRQLFYPGLRPARAFFVARKAEAIKGSGQHRQPCNTAAVAAIKGRRRHH